MKNTDSHRLPIVPEDRFRGNKTKSVHRMLCAHALTARAGHHDNASKFLERTWPDDGLAAMLTRAASGAATTSNSADLVQTLASTILTGIAPASAAVKLFASCVQLDFGTANTFNVSAPSMPAPVFV